MLGETVREMKTKRHQKVIIPTTNESELRELSDEIKGSLNFVLAENINDVLVHAFVK